VRPRRLRRQGNPVYNAADPGFKTEILVKLMRQAMFENIGRVPYWLVAILFVSLFPLVMRTQETTAREKKEEKPAQKPLQNVTGCLQKGHEAGEFSITGEDGKTWGLRSSSVKLSEHVGHKVTVTGSTTRETKAEEKGEGKVGRAAGKEESGDLRVTSLTMISETCK